MKIKYYKHIHAYRHILQTLMREDKLSRGVEGNQLQNNAPK